MFRLIIIALTAITTSLLPGYNLALILDVPNEYATIQGAIDAANGGDTVFIHRNLVSSYFEQIEIDKSICLLGEESKYTMIAGPETGDVIHITANACIIRKLKMHDINPRELG